MALSNSDKKFVAINIASAAGIFMVLLWIVNTVLSSYAGHGESLTVPSLKGQKLDKAVETLEDLDLRWSIQDSSYKMDLAPGAIIDQNPEPGAQVKESRVIYLIVNASQPPKTEVPDLAGKSSLKQAQLLLQSYGFKVGNLIYKPDPHLNAVLGLQANGRNIKPHTKLPKGTVIDLFIGDGFGGGAVALPYLIGLKFEEAKFKLQAYGLNLGAVVVEDGVTDTLSAWVIKQMPDFSPGNTVHTGEPIDLFLAPALPSDLVIHPEWYEISDSASNQ